MGEVLQIVQISDEYSSRVSTANYWEIHKRQFVTISCEGKVLFQKITNILFSILCKISHSMLIVNFNNISEPDVIIW